MNELTIIQSIPQDFMPTALPKHEKGIPPLPEWLTNPDELTIDLLAPSRFFSVTQLQDEFEYSEQKFLELEMVGMSLELTTAPNETPSPTDWHLCISFAGRGEQLVLNSKGRLKAMAKRFGTRYPKAWKAEIANGNHMAFLYIEKDQKLQRDVLMIGFSEPSVNGKPYNVINVTEDDEIPF